MSVTSSGSPYVKLEQGLFGATPQLRAVVAVSEETFVSLLVKQRGPADFVVVLKRLGASGEDEVIFGSGFDLVGALLGLEGSLAANRWRVDKPYVKGA